MCKSLNNRTIIHDINSIYTRFSIPDELQRHMRLVAGVAAVLLEHWNGPALDDDAIIAECLLHDLGNILKITGDSELDRELYTEQEREQLLELKQDVQETYGDTPHDATLAMAQELDLSERLLYLLDQAEFLNVETVVQSDDWELKICTYSDQRAAPHGIVSIQERFDDASDRYPKDSEVGVALQSLRDECYTLQEQVFANVDISPDDVPQCLKELERSWLPCDI